MGRKNLKSVLGEDRTICLPFKREEYCNVDEDPKAFRKSVDDRIEQFPELFPDEICQGYLMKDIRHPKKVSVTIRRMETGGVAYSVRPSFVMPYMTGFVDDMEKALFTRKFGLPFWVVSRSFGRDPMYWYRIEQMIGRNSLVGTTVGNPDDIPRHLAADEKHTWNLGEKVYVATAVGNECVLGASVSRNAGESALTDAYGVFKDESRHLNPAYSPDTVNTDGWKATRNALTSLFPAVVIICCFLHVFIKIRDRAKKKCKEVFHEVATRFWDCWRAENKASFSQRIRRLCEWCGKNGVPDVISTPIEKLRRNIEDYKVAYDFPQAHRTSNMLDRIMRRMDQWLFDTQYFHGKIAAAELSVRGWALIQNFGPANPHTVRKHNGLQSPAERLNQFRYHDNWLQNLLISASLKGAYRRAPQKTL